MTYNGLDDPFPNGKDRRNSMRLLVVDSSPVLLAGLTALLGRRPEFEVTAAADAWDVPSDAQATAAAASVAPHSDTVEAAIVDIASRTHDGWRDVRRIQDIRPAMRVVVMDDAARENQIRRAMRADLSGYIVKHDPIQNLVETLESLRRNDFVVSASVLSLGRPRSRNGVEAVQKLTEREIEIVRQIGNGLPPKAIAALLKISANTLDNHKTRILHKLGMHRTADLIRFAIGSGLSSVDESNCFPPDDDAASPDDP
jgi:DNA-binding NarL/FixJ family response regulator